MTKSLDTSYAEKINGVLFETQINDYCFSFEYKKTVTSDADTSSRKEWLNTTRQEINGVLGVPLGESFLFNIALQEILITQPYTSSRVEYKSYEMRQKFNLTLGYLY